VVSPVVNGFIKPKSKYYQGAITTALFAAAALVAPAITKPLESRTGIVLTHKAAFAIAGLNLATKATLFALSYIASYLKRTGQHHYYQYYVQYYSGRGKEAWENLDVEAQFLFLENLPQSVYTLFPNFFLTRHSEEDIKTLDAMNILPRFFWSSHHPNTPECDLFRAIGF